MWLHKAARQGGIILLACTATTLLLPWNQADGQEGKSGVLRIGTSGTMGPKSDPAKEKAGMDTLQSFIKDETGMNDEIIRQKDWRECSEKLSKGNLEVGVFQGPEFAWAQEKYPQLKPLALAINVYRYPTAYLVAKRTEKARDFAGLQGQTISIPQTGEDFLRLFVESHAEALGKKADSFFSKITTPTNVEDALDDVVDGVTQATVADRGSLEAYKRRKPGRFHDLRPIAQSQPFPPAVIAYYGKGLDDSTRQRFLKGLVDASRNEKGKMMLTLFHLTHFDPVPNDFDAVLAKTRKNYPAPK